MERHVFTSWVLVLTCVVVVGGTGGVAGGQRVLVDVGLCHSGPGYGPIAVEEVGPGIPGGPSDFPAEDGNWWNNQKQNPRWTDTCIDLCDTDGNLTGATMDVNVWAQCADGEQVAGSTPVSNLYPEKAQTDCRWWNGEAGALGVQPGIVTVAGLDPGSRYDFTFYGYVTSGQTRVGGLPFADGTTVYTIGGSSVELDVMDNTTEVALIEKVVPWEIAKDGQGAAVYGVIAELTGGSPEGCMAVLNVLDFAVRPWIPGDADKNDRVDYIDLGILATYYDMPGTWNEGDFNNDGSVDYQDLGILATYYGLDETGGASSSPVPEPVTALLLAAAAVPALIRRRRAA